MRLATIEHHCHEQTALVLPGGVLPLANLDRDWPADFLTLLTSGRFYELKDWFDANHATIPEDTLLPAERIRFRPLYRRPRKIWGIGLNYVAHAADLAEKAPHEEPASFMKPDTTIIGPGDAICIPRQSAKTTGEAELGIIFGREGRNVSEADWLSVVAGFTTVLDMTAEDILRKNPRFLTRSKSFDTFFSFGPVLITPDEIPDVHRLQVATVINGHVHAGNVVANMTFPPSQLVAFHSRVMPWLPGDILSTGTPQAVPLQNGDVLECRIEGFPPLRNPVRDLKLS